MILDGIDYGHNCPPDTGASGWVKEDVGTKDVGEKVVAGLKATPGHDALCATPIGQTFNSVIGSLAKRCQIANNANVDRFISIHMNAFDGKAHGVEIFANSEAAKAMAKPILDNLVALGFANRGIKSESLYVLRNTKAPAILIEFCFCDSAIDRALYNADTIANAIVRGLTGQNAVNIPAPSPVEKQVQAVSWNREIANLQHLLNTQGFRDKNYKLLIEDGYVGELTLSAAAKCVVRRGATGDITRWIQKRLGISTDGIFGNDTQSSVMVYQNSKGLNPDGIVGQNTWRKLLGL